MTFYTTAWHKVLVYVNTMNRSNKTTNMINYNVITFFFPFDMRANKDVHFTLYRIGLNLGSQSYCVQQALDLLTIYFSVILLF